MRDFVISNAGETEQTMKGFSRLKLWTLDEFIWNGVHVNNLPECYLFV